MPRRKGRRAARRSKKRGGRSPQGAKNTVVVVNRSRHVFPTRFRTVLRFNTSGVMNQPGQVDTNVRYVPTFAYDIDPTLGSTACPGFTEAAALYRLYRVNKFRATYNFVNKESFGVQVFSCPVNTDPGANTSSYQKYLSSRDCRSRTLGPATGNSSGRIVMPWTGPAEFGGVNNPNIMDTYVGLTAGGSPTNNIWSLVGATTDGTVLSNGVFTTITIDIDIDFFELLNPAA